MRFPIFVAVTVAPFFVQCGGSPSETPATPPTPTTPATPATPAAVAPSTPPTPSSPPAQPEASAAPAPSGPPRWGYDAPEKWGDLAPDWATCKTGQKQTPIDLASKSELGKDLKPLAFTYAPVPLQIFNNGHTVQVKNTAAASVMAGGQKWDLVQFHFHAPSEHTVDGKAFDAELHLVHKNAAGELAVVGVLLNKGKESKALAPFFDNAPKDVSSEPKAIDKASVDLKGALPGKTAYYTYSGSLTIPPCTEGITWFIFTQPMTISDAQIGKLKDTMGPNSARPIQPLNGRTVQRSK
jgi:carbonic anhydrase